MWGANSKAWRQLLLVGSSCEVTFGIRCFQSVSFQKNIHGPLFTLANRPPIANSTPTTQSSSRGVHQSAWNLTRIKGQIVERLEAMAVQYQTAVEKVSGAEGLAPAEMLATNKEMGKLEPIVHQWEAFRSLKSEVADLKYLLQDEDTSVQSEAESELQVARDQMSVLEEDLVRALLPRDMDDERDIVLEIRPGPGGDEAGLFAADLFKMYRLYAAQQNWQFEIVQESNTLIASIKGANVHQCMKYENGVHRVQRVPVTDTKGRIHTSTAVVCVMPEPDEVSVDINDSDLKIETMRASGAGGQHVNTTDSAIRITHLPSGLAVHISEERSQHKNRARAMELLAARLYDMERRKADDKERDSRRLVVGTGDRSERIRTYNFPENRVTDHRVNLTTYGVAEMLQSLKLQTFLDALEMEDNTQKMVKLET